MDLAMLHAYQMQALNAQHEDQLEEVRAAARRVQQDLQELLTEHPELKQMHNISSQTDLLFGGHSTGPTCAQSPVCAHSRAWHCFFVSQSPPLSDRFQVREPMTDVALVWSKAWGSASLALHSRTEIRWRS